MPGAGQAQTRPPGPICVRQIKVIALNHGLRDQPAGRAAQAPASRATSARSSGPNQGGAPAAAFSAIRAGEDVAGIATWQRGSLKIHFNNACAQVVTPKACNGASAAGAG